MLFTKTSDTNRTFFGDGLRVNADADAYVETLQTVAVKSPRIDSAANRGRPYVFQQDSASSHKALKIQANMNGREFSLSCHIKLMATF
ncbi:hypothetical protein ACTXT7_008217 [Hymenolepis weldensis]